MAKNDERAAKVAYVKSQGQTREHHCHWPGCSAAVPPRLWGCSKHWFTLPGRLRGAIHATYRPGQEITKTPSAEYVKVAREVQEWIATRETVKPQQDLF